MKNFIFNLLSPEEKDKNQGKKEMPNLRARRLQMESLESREMLSISPSSLNLVQSWDADYSQFLQSNTSVIANTNIIELKEELLTAEALRQAVEISTQTREDDLIILRTTNDYSSITWDIAPLEIDFDSSLYGSIAIVGLGAGEVTVDAGGLSSIFQITSGNVLLGNLHFVGNAVGTGSVENNLDYFVQTAKSANVSTQMVAASLCDTAWIQNITSEVSESSKVYGTNFMIDDQNGVFIVGQLENTLETVLNITSADYYIEDYFDAEKNGQGDLDLCWAGSTANMLAYTKWGYINGMNDEDDILELFRQNFTDLGGHAYYATDWFLTGGYQVIGQDGWAQPTSDGGGYYKDQLKDVPEEDNFGIFYSNFWGEPEGEDLIDQIDRHLRAGDALGLGIGWFDTFYMLGNEYGIRYGGHAISVWGYSYETIRGVKTYTGLFVTDPDDDKFAGRDAPNVLAYYTISYDPDTIYNYQHQGCYVFDTYGGYYTGAIENVAYLKQLSSDYSLVDLNFNNTPSQWVGPAYLAIDQDTEPHPVEKATTKDTVYLNFSVQREGRGIAVESTASVTVTDENGNTVRTINVPVPEIANYNASNPNASYSIELRNIDLGILPEGVNTVTIVLDANNDVVENDKTNNTHTLTIDIVDVNAPANFITTGQTEDSVSLSWTAPEGITVTRYVLEYKKENETTWTEAPTPEGAETTVYGLTPNTTYNFRIKTIHTEGESGWAKLTTKTLLIEPQTPTSFVCTTQAMTSLSFQWDNADDAQEYEIQYKLADAETWQSISPAGTLDSGKWHHTISNLTADSEYEIRLRAKNDAGESEWVTITASTLDHEVVIPATPSGFSTDSATSNSITLRWVLVENVTYELQYRLQGLETWSDVPEGTVVPGQGTATLSGLPASTTYEFRLRAVNDDGQSDWTDTLTAATTRVPPAVPIGFQIQRESITTDSITLQWQDAEDTTKYEIQYRKAGEEVWNYPAADNPHNLEDGLWTLTVLRLTHNTTYEFRMRATNEGGSSDWTPTLTATTLRIPMPPEEPTGFQVEDWTTDSIMFRWDVANDADEYRIQYRMEGVLTWSNIPKEQVEMKQLTNHWTATVSGLLEFTRYEFRLQAINEDGPSDWTPSIKAATAKVLVPPEMPTGFVMLIKTTDSMTFQWNNADDALKYVLQYRLEGGNLWSISPEGTLSSDLWTTTIVGLTPATTYEFRLCAINTDGMSPWTETLTRTTDHILTPPATPVGFHSTGKTRDSVSLRWTNAGDADEYKLGYRPVGSENWIEGPSGTLEENRWIATVNGLVTDTEYEFRLQAINNDGDSDWTDSLLVTTDRVLAPPEVPERFDEESVTTNSITLQWDKSDDALVYDIQYRPEGWDTWNVCPAEITEGIDHWSATVFGLTSSTTYEFRLSATNTDGTSSWTNIISATTDRIPVIPDVPTGFEVYGVTSDSVTLQWKEAENAERYEIQYRRSGSTDWNAAPIGTVFPTELTAIIPSLAASTSYEFRMRSVNGDGESDWTNPIAATTAKEVLPPETPDDFHVDLDGASAATSITLTWYNDRNVDRYELQYRQKDSGEWIVGPQGYLLGNQWTVTVSDLLPLTTYEFRLRAYNAAGVSDWAEISAKTGDESVLPDVPTGFDVTAFTTNQIDLMWNKSENALTYELQYRLQKNTSWLPAPGTISIANVCTANVFELAPSSTYVFRVRAVNDDGHSNWTSEITATTRSEEDPPVPPMVPTGFAIEGVTTNSVTVRWNVSDDAVSYELQYLSYAGTFWVWHTVPEEAMGSGRCTVSGLESAITYDFRLRAINADGMSDWTATLTAVTDPDVIFSNNIIAIGADAGPLSKPIVQVYDAESGGLMFTFYLEEYYGENYTGGVRVATGDLDGDGVPDIAVAPGRNAVPNIVVFSGRDGSLMPEYSIPASATYGTSFKDGLSIAIGDVVGDEMNDIILVPSGGQAVVRVFENTSYGFSSQVVQFNAFEDRKEYIGGASVTAGDLDGSATQGKQQIVLGTGSGIAPIVRVYDVQDDWTFMPIQEIKTTSGGTQGGINVAVGDINGDGTNELIVAAKNGGMSLVEIYLVYPETTPRLLSTFQAYSGTEGNNVAVNVVARDTDGDGIAEIYTSQGAKGKTGYTIKKMIWNNNLLQPELVDTIFADWPNTDSDGLFLG